MEPNRHIPLSDYRTRDPAFPLFRLFFPPKSVQTYETFYGTYTP